MIGGGVGKHAYGNDDIYPVSDATVKKRRMRPDLRRAQLMKCALRATAEHGIARVTHSHIAKISGVSIPTVHVYFRSREDLVNAVLEVIDSHLTMITDECLLAEGTPYERLLRLAMRFGQDAKAEADMIMVWLDWSTGVLSPVWERYLFRLIKLHRSVEEVLEEGLAGKADLTPEEISTKAKLYVGGGHTLALMQFAGATDAELVRFSEHLAKQALSV